MRTVKSTLLCECYSLVSLFSSLDGLSLSICRQDAPPVDTSELSKTAINKIRRKEEEEKAKAAELNKTMQGTHYDCFLPFSRTDEYELYFKYFFSETTNPPATTTTTARASTVSP